MREFESTESDERVAVRCPFGVAVEKVDSVMGKFSCVCLVRIRKY